ncbi:hypothetical protein cand_032770 [Cryptosporidium andersoni]|uniref:Uncharacterized protein n=1 Tax=Cryptosporidium andersoni TaxID=117008 RepID=A0A1J4MEW3_9CRYT|nr:hypothetical protein cand_032770 [Cryptosporidium andersoni]
MKRTYLDKEIRKKVLDSERFSSLIDDELHKRTMQRLYPCDVFSTAYYEKSDEEKQKILEIANQTYNNLYNRKHMDENSESSQCLGNLPYRKQDSTKQDYLIKLHQEKINQEEIRKVLQQCSAREQKLYREFSSDVVLGNEQCSREKMIIEVSNYQEPNYPTNSSNYDDDLMKYRQIYPAYSNILNNENDSVALELRKRSSLPKHNKNTDTECIADLIPGIPRHNTLSCRNYANKIPEYNLNNLESKFTPIQKNLSSKLLGEDFYNKIAYIQDTSFVRFRLSNLTTGCNEELIQKVATQCGVYAYQVIVEIDPVLGHLKGGATGKLRFHSGGLENFKKVLWECYGIQFEIIGDIQKEPKY